MPSNGWRREVRPGVWEVQVASGYRSDGGRRRISRTVRGTAEDADAEIRALRAELGRCPGNGDHVTLDEYFERWFMPGREATTTRANCKTYRSIYRCHISPALGSREVGSLTNVDVQSWADSLPAQSAPAYARALRAILSQAEFDHVVERSPMEGYRFRMPRGRRRGPLPVWGAGEVAEALSRPEWRESRLYPLWLVMVGAGLSRSEALALDWEDVSWREGPAGLTALLRVERACTRDDGMKEPKNDRRYRIVPMPTALAAELRSRRGHGPICQSVRRDGLRTGRRLSPSYVPQLWRAQFGPGGPLEGIPYVLINRMRATYSTLAQSAGVDPTLINAIQGRSVGSEVLYSNYLNPDVSAYAAAAERVGGRLAGGDPWAPAP